MAAVELFAAGGVDSDDDMQACAEVAHNNEANHSPAVNGGAADEDNVSEAPAEHSSARSTRVDPATALAAARNVSARSSGDGAKDHSNRCTAASAMSSSSAHAKKSSASSTKKAAGTSSATASRAPSPGQKFEAVPSKYTTVLSFLCKLLGVSMSTAAGHEFTGAQYCRVLHAIAPNTRMDMGDVCWNPTPLPVQESENLRLFIAACESLELDWFPRGMKPSVLRPRSDYWSNHVGVQMFLYRLAVTNCFPVDGTGALPVLPREVCRPEPRCESGVMTMHAIRAAAVQDVKDGIAASQQSEAESAVIAPAPSPAAKKLPVGSLALKRHTVEQQKRSTTTTTVRGSKVGGTTTGGPTSQRTQSQSGSLASAAATDPFATPVVSAAPSARPSAMEEMDGNGGMTTVAGSMAAPNVADHKVARMPHLHPPAEHLDADALNNAGKEHLLMQYQLRSYRAALRKTKQNFLAQVAAGSHTAAAIDWAQLTAAVQVPKRLQVEALIAAADAAEKEKEHQQALEANAGEDSQPVPAASD